jgi:hypothetical protein
MSIPLERSDFDFFDPFLFLFLFAIGASESGVEVRVLYEILWAMLFWILGKTQKKPA